MKEYKDRQKRSFHRAHNYAPSDNFKTDFSFSLEIQGKIILGERKRKGWFRRGSFIFESPLQLKGEPDEAGDSILLFL